MSIRPNFRMPAVSPYPIVGWRQVLLLDVPFDGGFVLLYCSMRHMLLLGAPFGGGFVLSLPRFALEALEFLPRLHRVCVGGTHLPGEGAGEWK